MTETLTMRTRTRRPPRAGHAAIAAVALLSAVFAAMAPAIHAAYAPAAKSSVVTTTLLSSPPSLAGQASSFVFPRRRSSATDAAAAQMQSRAVDMRIQLEVVEAEPRGTSVGFVPIKPGFTYRFNEPPREFNLDPNTGEIRTNAVLDREQRDRYDLVVLSSQPTYPIEVRITVLDVNDNAPEFPEPSIAVSFSESAVSGTRLLLDAATDRDIGNNSVTDDYRIVAGNHDDKFRLAVTTNPSGDVSYLHLETTGKLDRESRGFYALNISARDGGDPPQNGYLLVNVTVLDVNDNPPIFDHSDYIVSLNESVPPGSPVLQVMASDNDLGDNAKITYYLADTERQFTVDPETGVIATTEPLTCPHQNCAALSSGRGGSSSCPKSCVFTVFARDHGSPRQDGRTYVTVNLVDTNDHDPLIRFQYFPPTGLFATVDENAINGSVVAAVSVEDMDEGLNGDTNISILSGNELQHFRLEKTPSFDLVRVNGVLDREEIGKYNLTVVATDKGAPPRTATAYLIIHVNDVNDHEPVFEKSEYSAILSELAPPGSYVASITATDEDTGVNAQIYYDFVSGNTKQWFAIDSGSGLITTQAALDREVQGTVELSISARDGGPNPKWAYTQLKVTILDENDEAPQFSQPHINVSLSENTAVHTLVAMLTAADHDQGTNGSVTYSLQTGVQQRYPGVFALDTLTGQLMTKSRLDREQIAGYDIRVVARDQGTPPQSATATVFLTVLDVNDNSPVFYPRKYFVPVAEDAAIGAELVRVQATDRDEGDNAIVTYTLESGGDGMFAVDMWTGAVTLRSSVRGSAKALWKLVITAKDRGDRHSETDATVEIIKESKMEELEFDSFSGYEFQIIEDPGNSDEEKSTEVTTVSGRPVGRTLIRSNPNAAAPVEYSIVLGDAAGSFRIDPSSGHIQTARAIDRESIASYTLTVVARSALAYARTTVNVSVLDVNDNAPVFARDTRDELRLPENTAVGQEVYLARARDRDAGVNSRVAYSLTYNPDEQFRISESSGVLYLNRPIRTEPGKTVHVELTATDGGTPPLSTKNTLAITIEDVNDHTPVFDHTSYETSLSESTPVNARFFALAASDADLGRNSLISYSITEGNANGRFGIFPDGYMFVRSQLDREDRDYYSLTIACTDHGDPARSSMVPVIVHVIDENDNAPQFANATFTFSIPENEPADAFVGKLSATDRDSGRNAELIYTLSVQEDFTVDPRNGFVKSARSFDREELVQRTGQASLLLEAIVHDNGVQRLQDRVKVRIEITDVNDNAPQFLRTPYKVQVSEGSSLDAPLIRVYTVDADEGLNGDVFYSIEAGNTDGRFAIDEATGQVTVARQLDRESVSTYRLAVVASDAAIKGRLSATTTIQIDVLDENDNAPEFTQTNTHIAVNETTPVGRELMRFRASDSDLGVNSAVTFSISAGNRRDTFHIDTSTGSLFLHKPLDYEDTTAYVLNITAADGGTPRLSTTIAFNVNVIDENDNPPSFPNTAIVRQIREGIPRQTPIVTVTAEDPDSGANGKVTYAIRNQDPLNHRRHFDINAATGVIHTLLDIDREAIDTFRLTVVATDQAQPVARRLSAEKIVTVIVEDINDNAPIFVSMNAAVLPLGDTRMRAPGHDGSVIMHVFARDADSSTNGLVTYELVSGNAELFKLHRSTGAISLRGAIARPEVRYQLAVKATDEAVQAERKSSDAYVTIIATGGGGGDAAQPVPLFEQREMSGSVYENEAIGTSILTVRARLPSAAASAASTAGGSGEIEYYVTNVTGDGRQVDRLFDVDTKLGILSTAAELDRELGVAVYEVEVYAIVTGGAPRTASIKVKVTVLDKNDSPPEFRDTPLHFTVSEDLGAGHAIATIRATDPDTIGTLTYTLRDTPSSGANDANGAEPPGSHFRLDADSGVLTLRDTLDRETKDVYELVVRVSDGIQYTETTVTVQVTDTNDNPPIFTEPAYSFDIPESAQRGHQVGVIAATDADLGANALISYTVISDWANDVFSLNPQTGVFTLTARLDYEEVQHYILVVQAQDNGHPSLSTTLTVYCNVLDLNDNAPVFDPMSYSNEVYENVPLGTEVVTVSATDVDSGDNGRIEYAITAGDELGAFHIHPNGTIVTRRELDRETRSAYGLVVQATDSARPPEQRLSSTVQVTITLRDVNDCAPEFVTPNVTTITENVPLSTVVTAIKASDRDEGRNGYIEYSLVSDAAAHWPFTLGTVDGLLRVSGRIDRELQAEYTLAVVARDRGDPPLSTAMRLVVRVLDENDNSPVFDPKQYSASVAENASIGAMVLQVSATDIDEAANGRIRFSIAAGDENRDFSISEDSGIVRVAKNLNYERKVRYTLTVRAEDCAGDVAGNAAESRYDMAELSIAITDINDNAPTFLDSPYLAYVMENVIPPNGGYVITVHASDADSPPFNSQVRYFLKEGDADLFRINASSGEISLLRALDREAQDEYTLTLVAMDTGSPPLTGTGTVHVIVQDTNDHNPQFERPSYEATVVENLPAGTLVLQPSATDLDAGLNAYIRYSLLGERIDRFRIDATTGRITTAQPLDREDVALYALTLMAQDSSPTEPRATAVTLTVRVSDVNDNTPHFAAPTFSVNIPDRIKAGRFVFGAEALDADEGRNSRLVYELSGKDASRFAIDADTGVVQTLTELSLNGQGADKSYSLRVRATDQGEVPRWSEAELTVLLRPAHQFPVFAYVGEAQYTLAEDVPEGTVIARIAATSTKKGAAGNIRYAIFGGNVRGSLRIDAGTGEITVDRAGLDYEVAQRYEVWIEAADSDRPSLRSIRQISINVTDANDNAPVMERPVYRAEVLENEAPPLLVTRVSATDRDSGENGQITYRLADDFEGTFEVDADNGEIFTRMKLDREEVASYELIVEAVDRGVPQQTGRASVLLTVLDTNDNPPRFTRLFSVNVTENAEIGAFVIRVTSSDQDVGENANATYSITDNPGEKFAIDALSGNVTVSGHLDREQQDEYVLKVVAVDGAWRSETPLTITIQDQNDNAPEFEHSYYSFNFPELQRAVSMVGQVIATDRDKQGPNSVISYSLQHPSDMFTIDPATGELFSKRTLHYRHTQLEQSPENRYEMTVLAIDNGKPPMYSECVVQINVVDANNNAPRFEQRDYLSPVPADAAVGQRIVQVVARDELDFGINAEIDYAIVGGNASAGLFQVNKLDGWITLAKGFSYGAGVFRLRVRAVDRGVPAQQDEVPVTIVVTGENRYSPAFTALSYQVIVPENEPIGSTILTVSATDGDDGPNGMIRYTISGGNERKEFAVDARSGAVTILRPLDYDEIQEYHLNITAEDLGFRPRSTVAMLTVTLTDINDNPPVFNQSTYDAYMAENSPANSVVFRCHATDKDSPKNAVIQYRLVGGSGRDLFTIAAGSGVITSKTSFDYEEETHYELEIVAVNPDSPMAGRTMVVVHITGVNEFYPRFVQPVFHFDVSESAAVGTRVGAVQATDKDAGEDGRVYYLLVGSSNDKGFAVNVQTGVMTVSRSLDRETQSRVVLTVLAKNYGGIRGNDTDEAQVIVSIQDGNDPPEFQHSVYDADVSEGAAIGAKVVVVQAVDTDVRPQNNQFGYSIIGGNVDQAFKVDPQTGQVETARRLDRETVASYALIVGAIDTGVPPATGTTMVKIIVTDINDNGPTFDPADRIGYVSENEPIGTSIMTLSASDPDLPPNGAPFTYFLIGGRHKSFVQLDKHTGLLKTTRTIDRETTPHLDLLVEVEDNGEPRQRSQHPIRVNIIDQNDSPSTPRTAQLLLHVFNGNVPAGKLADVHPNDLDTTGEYRCKILQDAQPPRAFKIPGGCELHAGVGSLQPGHRYTYSVSGNDGRHADVVSTISVEMAAFDNQTVDNSVTLSIDNMTAVHFLASHFRSFGDQLAAAFDGDDRPLVYGLHERNTSLEVTLAVRTATTSGYRPAAHIVERLQKKRQAMQQLLQTPNLQVGYSPCSATTCDNGAVCSEHIHVAVQRTQTVDTPALIFTGPLIQHAFACRCTEGYAGARCERRQDPCSPSPCQAGGECRRQGYDFQCTCPAHREGRLCQLERGDACSSAPCQHGGSCRESPDGSSFFCLCRPGYRGNQCETVADSCRPNPCLHGGLCVALKPGYRCSCTDGRYGLHCERATFGFGELSYMTFPALDAATNDIAIVFATTKPDALLLYNYGTQSGGRSDFVAMEIVRSKAMFSFGGARTAITSVQTGGVDGTLSNGKWHKVTATRNGRVMSLSVARCSENGDVCEECRPGDAACYADDVGPTGTLNFNKQPLLIGGLASADPVLERPDQIHSDDLVGCVHSVQINGRPLNLSSPLQSHGVQPTCGRNTNGGPCSVGLADDPSLAVCGPHGQCMDRWQTAQCRCGGSLLAPDCYSSLDAISLGDGGFVEFLMSERHRRMQLLEGIYAGSTVWESRQLQQQQQPQQRTRRALAPVLNTTTVTIAPPKTVSLMFRTMHPDGLLMYAATNRHYTLVQLRGGRIAYASHQQSTGGVNMTLAARGTLADGRWHNVTLWTHAGVLRVLIDGERGGGDELDAAGVHDFLDPYLTVLAVGGVRRELFPADAQPPASFDGCLANFTVGAEIQPFNGSGSVFAEVLTRGKVYQGCHGVAGGGVDAERLPDPLSIGITLVIVFFVILLVAILVSFVVFRLRKQHKEKSGGLGGGVGGGVGGGGGGVGHGHGVGGSSHGGKLGGVPSMLSAANGGVGSDGMLGRGHMLGDSVGFHADGDLIRGIGHHLVGGAGPELLAKKYKERDLLGNGGGGPVEPQPRPQRPDIIEREVIGGAGKGSRDDQHHPMPMPMPPQQQLHSHSSHDHPGGGHHVDMNEYPEHYDLENASSIAPSDIDIVYHYKGYRDGGGPRKYKAQPPPVASYGHHKHATVAAHQRGVDRDQQQREQQQRDQQQPQQNQQQQQQPQQHRHSPHHVGGPFGPRSPPQSSQPPPPSNGPRPHQSTPLARLSPSSELSSQQPRILTLHDISGKPLQSALLATTSSSGGVGKDALHSNSERSLNSPVMSQLSGQGSSASRTKPGVPPPAPNGQSGGGGGGGGGVGHLGLTAEEIQRLNARPRTSSLVSTLDAVSSSSEAPRGAGGVQGHHMQHMHHSPAVDAHSSTTTDESGNDSFTCSEIEYDNNSMNGDAKFPKSGGHDDGDNRGGQRDVVDGGGGSNGTVNGHGNGGGNQVGQQNGGSGMNGGSAGGQRRAGGSHGDGQTNGGGNGQNNGGSNNLNGGQQGANKNPSQMPPAYADAFDSSSFRGSLSTLAASDDELSAHHHMGGGMYHRPPNAASPSAATTLGWDYLLNWGPNFESLMGVYKDMAGELPESGGGGGVGGQVVVGGGMVPGQMRLPPSVQKPSEEYV